MAQNTPLSEHHQKNGGKMVEFAGWNMPVEFQGLKAEHAIVREKVGLFDVSHMGEIRVRGDKALESLEWLTTNSVATLKSGEAQYSLLPNDQGGLVDDLIIYCLEPGTDYLLCVNASNKDKDLQWILKHNRGADITDESDQWGQVAVQGPKAMALVERLFTEAKGVESFQFVVAERDNHKFILARTGYTGEEGFEIFAPAALTEKIWVDLLEKGEELGVAPIGLGARDTLRTEMRFSLYGHEINETTNPYAAGLGWVVKPQAKDFLGRDQILAAREAGLSRQLVGFQMLERGIPRQAYPLFSFDNKQIGEVTSGTVSPTTGESIGIAYIDREWADLGQEFQVEIRARRVRAQVVKTPFVHQGEK